MDDNHFLMRALLAGALLAVLGVGVFLLMYFVVLASAEDLPRLLGALVVPPLVIGVLVGGYALLRPRKSDA